MHSPGNGLLCVAAAAENVDVALTEEVLPEMRALGWTFCAMIAWKSHLIIISAFAKHCSELFKLLWNHTVTRVKYPTLMEAVVLDSEAELWKH